MGKMLVIVESPSKAKTIHKYLGDAYVIEASKGHIRDLPDSRFGIDLDHGFVPEYEVIGKQKATVSRLKKECTAADAVYLAPDPDREGEAIAWHLAETLHLPPEKTYRVTFNEITRKAIEQAFQHPSRIDIDKVNAQQARRIVDRIVGYKLSPLLWKKVAKGLSAGRVQSVAVRLVVERDREIGRFTPQEYWRVTAQLAPQEPAKRSPEEGFRAELRRYQGQEIGLGKALPVTSAAQASDLVAQLEKATYVVRSVEQKRQKSHPYPPFITSTLQQQASIRLGFSGQRTMKVAQTLYEGVDLGGDEGPVGLITYMRTDSVRVSGEAVAEARDLITQDFGPNYLPAEARAYRSRTGAQEAHEAIRPTEARRRPSTMKHHLSSDQYELYRLIWERFIASQMASAEYDVTEVEIEAGPGLFVARGRVMVFDGYLRVTGAAQAKTRPARANAKRDEAAEGDDEKDDEQAIPPLVVQQCLDLLALTPSQHFTKPPAHFNEASLVKALESEGIGRPSTYAPIIATIQQRGYVEKVGRQFRATDLGTIVTDKLVQHFPDIVNVNFTSKMEDELDKIEEGLDWVRVTDEFYQVFRKDLEKASKEMTTASRDLAGQKDAEVICETCGKKMVLRISKRGKFLGCSGYPRCQNTKPLDRPEDGRGELPAAPAGDTDQVCDVCGKKMVVKMARRGRSRGARFLACSGYPACKAIKPFVTRVPCPTEGCGGVLAERASRGSVFYGCTRYPDCKYAAKQLPNAPGGDVPAASAEAPLGVKDPPPDSGTEGTT